VLSHQCYGSFKSSNCDAVLLGESLPTFQRIRAFLFRLFDPEYEGTTLLSNVGNHMPNYAASQPRKLASSKSHIQTNLWYKIIKHLNSIASKSAISQVLSQHLNFKWDCNVFYTVKKGRFTFCNVPLCQNDQSVKWVQSHPIKAPCIIHYQ